MTDYSTIHELYDRRGEVLARIEAANKELADLNARIRFASGDNDPDDFSGAVERLRQKGILPPKK